MAEIIPDNPKMPPGDTLALLVPLGALAAVSFAKSPLESQRLLAAAACWLTARFLVRARILSMQDNGGQAPVSAPVAHLERTKLFFALFFLLSGMLVAIFYAREDFRNEVFHFQGPAWGYGFAILSCILANTFFCLFATRLIGGLQDLTGPACGRSASFAVLTDNIAADLGEAFFCVLFLFFIDSAELTKRLSLFWHGVVVGAAIVFFSFREGSQGMRVNRTRLMICLLACLSNFETVREFVLGTYDLIMEKWFVHSPVAMRIAVPATFTAAMCAMVLPLLNSGFFWRGTVLNRMAVKTLAIYLSFDPQGRFHARLMHAWHLACHPKSPLRWFWSLFPSLWMFLLGKPPAFLLPKSAEGMSRYEKYVRAVLKNRQNETGRKAELYRAARIVSSPDAKRRRQELEKALERQAETLIALETFLACPFRPCRPERSACESWESAVRLERLYATVRRFDLFRNFREARNGPVQKALALLRQAYSRLEDAGRDQSAFPDMNYLAAVRSDMLEGRGLDDVSRLAWRDSLVESLKDGDTRKAFAVGIFLSEMARAEDWPGIVEACRIMVIETPYKLGRGNLLDLAEACFFYAANLGDGFFGQWMWDRSLDHFYSAEAGEHLRLLAAPFPEKIDHDANID